MYIIIVCLCNKLVFIGSVINQKNNVGTIVAIYNILVCFFFYVLVLTMIIFEYNRRYSIKVVIYLRQKYRQSSNIKTNKNLTFQLVDLKSRSKSIIFVCKYPRRLHLYYNMVTALFFFWLALHLWRATIHRWCKHIIILLL